MVRRALQKLKTMDLWHKFELVKGLTPLSLVPYYYTRRGSYVKIINEIYNRKWGCY